MKYKLPEGVAGASYGGESLEVTDGTVEAPHEAAEAFASHGLFPVVEDAPADTKFIDGSVKAIKAGIASVADLDAFEAEETAGLHRVGVLDAIAVERTRRNAL